MNFNLDQWLQAFAVGAGLYAAIRADLAALKARMDRAEKAIDSLQDKIIK